MLPRKMKEERKPKNSQYLHKYNRADECGCIGSINLVNESVNCKNNSALLLSFCNIP